MTRQIQRVVLANIREDFNKKTKACFGEIRYYKGRQIPHSNERMFFMKRNYYLDCLLFISGIICIVTGLMLDFHLISGGKEVRSLYKHIHIYSGYFMGLALIIHLLWHKGWISQATKKILGRKNTNITT